MTYDGGSIVPTCRKLCDGTLDDPTQRGFRDMLIIAFMDKDAGRYGPSYEIEVAGIEGDPRKIAEVSVI